MINANLCSLCQPITFETIKAKGITLPLQPYLDAWKNKSGSQVPCGLCAHLQYSLRLGPAYRAYTWIYSWDTLVLLYNEHTGLVVVSATREEFLQMGGLFGMLLSKDIENCIQEQEFDFEFAFMSVYLNIGASRSDFTSHRLISPNPGSQICLNLAKRWLETCTEQHGERCQLVDTSFIPTRLIELSSMQREGLVRLVSVEESKNIVCLRSVKYAALSYCWGAEPFLTTTSSNIREMHQGILISTLPKTVQNAIEVTRFMGLDYLWVDSLCILQGQDPAAQKDWRRESLTMGQIYQSAYFTISADSSPAASVGIFKERSSLAGGYCAIPQSEQCSEAVYLSQRQLQNTKIEEPLNSRGWALQETMLSKRLLRFGSREISWRCPCAEQTESRCEMQGRLSSNRNDNPEQFPASIGQAIKTYHEWRKVMEDYSARSLSKSSDKLPAIAGLARLVERATGDAYLAGIWRRNASRTLLWKHDQDKQEYARKKEFQAPTWSWASVEGQIQFLVDYQQMTDLVINFMPSKGGTVAGFEGQSQLLIKGSVLRMKSIRFQHFASYYGAYENYRPWARLWDPLETYLDDLEDIPPQHRKGSGEEPKELVDPTFLFLAQTHWNFFGRVHVPKADDIRSMLGAGLIIIPAGLNRYKRIGLFKGFLMGDINAKSQFSSSTYKWKTDLKRDNKWRKPERRNIVLI